ncbi:hypothetical protein Tco_1229439 [Tanacetum coccineum]
MTSSDEQHSQDDEVFTQIQPQITTVTNTNAKFPYLKKGEYDIWAMKMQNYITNSDLPCWNIVLNGNSRKKTTKDSNGNIKICPPVSAEEHLAVQRETKARTTLLTALPDDHMGDFYHLDDAKEIWLAIKARPCLRSLSQVTLVLKTKGGLKYSLLMTYHEDASAADEAQEKQALQAKLDNEIANTANWLQSSKNLVKLIDSSISVKDKISEPNVVMSKVWTDAPIIEEVDSDNEYVVTPGKANEKPSHADNKSAKFINTPRDKGNKHDSRRHMGKQVGEGYAFPKKACFVCGSLSHLIKDCDFHEKRMAQEQAMAKQNEKTNGMGNFNKKWDKMTIWENTQRVDPSNKFIPRAVLLQSGIVDLSSTRPNLSTPVPTGRRNLSKPVTTGRRNLPTPVPTGKAVPAGRPNYPILVASGRTNNTVRPFPSVFKPNRPNTQTPSPSKRPLHRASPPKTSFSYFGGDKVKTAGNPYKLTEDLGIVDSGCSRSMTGNRHMLENFQGFKGGNVTFGGGEGKITGKGTIRTAKLDFKNVLYVKELQYFNLFSVSQNCDNKNRVLFTETECLVLIKDFKLPDETQVLLKVLRKHNLYRFNLEDLVPQGDLACLLAKATLDEST